MTLGLPWNAPVESVRFPTEVFPAPIREYIESAGLLNYPEDFVGVGALVALAATIGDTHRIQVKAGWQEPAIIFAAIVGNAGVRKTAALTYSLMPLRKRQKDLALDYERELEGHRQELRRLKSQRSDEEPPPTPRAQQVITENFTTEALIALLHANPRGLLCCRDELASWTRDMNRYTPGSDEQQWLSLWSAQPITYNRKSQGGERLFVPSPVVSVVGGIQPGVLAELFGSGKNINGFSDRILFAWPEPITRRFVDEDVLPFVKERYERMFEKLFALASDTDLEGQPQPHIVKLSVEARQRFIEWDEAYINVVLNDTSVPTRTQSVVSKLEAYALRFALILHVTRRVYGEEPETTVSVVTMEAALRLVDYFAAQALKVLALMHQPPANAAERATTWIRERGGQATKRDLYRSRVGGITTEEAASAFFREAEAQGLGTVSTDASNHGGPPTERLTLHPV